MFDIQFMFKATKKLDAQELQLVTHILAGTETLDNFTQSRPTADDTDDPYAELRSIITRQSNLKQLEINDSKFFSQPINDLQFQLDSFRMLTKFEDFTALQIDNLKQFLSSQNDVQLDNCAFSKMIELPPTIKRVYDFLFVMEHHSDFSNVNLELCPTNPHVVEYNFSSWGMASTKPEKIAKMLKMTRKIYPNVHELHSQRVIITGLRRIYCVSDRDDFLEPLNVFQGIEKLNVDVFHSFRQLARVKILSLKSIDATKDNSDDADDFIKLNRLIVNHENLEELRIVDRRIGIESEGLVEFLEFIYQIPSKLKCVSIECSLSSGDDPEQFREDMRRLNATSLALNMLNIQTDLNFTYIVGGQIVGEFEQ